MNQKQLGRFLKKKRVSTGLTQGELAKKLGFSSSQFVSNIERGVAVIPSSRINEYSSLIGVEPTELLKLVSNTLNDRAVKRTTSKLNVPVSEEDPFIEAFISAWQTSGEKEKECIKIVAEKILGIEYTD